MNDEPKTAHSQLPVAINLDLLRSPENGESSTIQEDGDEVGKVSYVICADYDEICENYDFRAPFQHPLANYLAKVDLPEDYPIAYLPNVSVDKDKRNRGLGTRLLSELEEILYQKGCKLMFGKMGYEGDNLEGEKAKNQHFYHSRGWRSHSFSESGPILIFKTVGESKGEDEP